MKLPKLLRGIGSVFASALPQATWALIQIPSFVPHSSNGPAPAVLVPVESLPAVGRLGLGLLAVACAVAAAVVIRRKR